MKQTPPGLGCVTARACTLSVRKGQKLPLSVNSAVTGRKRAAADVSSAVFLSFRFRFMGAVLLLLACLACSPGIMAQDLAWAKGLRNIGNFGTGGSTIAHSAVTDGSGNVYVTGSFTNSADFDPGTGSVAFTSQGGDDIFIAKYDAAGGYLWAKSLGGTSDDRGYALVIDATGNSYVTGSFGGTVDFDPGTGTATLTAAGAADIFLAKYDSNGDFLWARAMGGTSDDYGYALALDGSGNINLTGYYSGTADLDPGTGVTNLTAAGAFDIFVAKYNPTGSFLWADGVGGTSNDYSYAIVANTAGEVYITGSFAETVDFDPGAGTASLASAGSQDIFIAKYDASGNYVWAHGMGASYDDIAYSMAIDAAGDIFIAGFFQQTVDFDPGAGTASLTPVDGSDDFLAKYDAAGNYVWAKSMGGSATDYAYAVTLDGSGNIYVTGAYSGTADFDPGAGTANLTAVWDLDIFVAKYDPTGAYIWAQSIGGYSTKSGLTVAVDASGNVFTGGHFTSTVDFDPGAGTANLNTANDDAFISKLSSSGDYVWAVQLGGYTTDAYKESGQAVAVDGGGNVYVAGYYGGTVDFDPGSGMAALTAAGSSNPFIAKYDASGNYVWAISLEGYSGRVTAIALDASGNLYATGYFYGTIDFDPGSGTAALTSVNSTADMFIAKYDADGHYLWANSMGGTSSEIAYSIALDSGGNPYVTGTFGGTVDFDPGVGETLLSAVGANDIFMAKYDAAGNYLWARQMGGSNNEYGYSLALDGSGNICLAGYFLGTVDFDPGAGSATLTAAGSSDIFIAKYDNDGNYLWAQRIGGSGAEYGYSLAVDGSGNICVTGSFAGTVDFDPGSGTANLVGSGPITIFLAKYDASGNYLWANALAGFISYGYSVAVDGNDNVYTTGAFLNTYDFDPGDGTASLTSNGGQDVYIAKYDASGNYVSAKNVGGSSTDYGYAIAVDEGQNVYVTGYFTGTADFDPGAGTATLNSVSGYDVFVAKYSTPLVLPLTWLSFTAVQQNTGVLVQWSTGVEQNTKDFVVQHSTDGRSFTAVGSLAAAGNSSYSRSYSFVDAHPASGLNYYRLLQRDLDGKQTYSPVVQVYFTASQKTFRIYPNPVAGGSLHIELQQPGLVQIYNNLGVCVWRNQMAAGQHQVALQQLAKGLYTLKVQGEVRCFVIQ